MSTDQLFGALAGLMVDRQAAEDGIWFEHGLTGDRFKVARWSSPRAAHLREQKCAAKRTELGRDLTEKDIESIDEEVFAEAVLTDWELKRDPTLKFSAALALAMVRHPQCYELVTWIRNQTFSAQFRGTKPSEVSVGN